MTVLGWLSSNVHSNHKTEIHPELVPSAAPSAGFSEKPRSMGCARAPPLAAEGAGEVAVTVTDVTAAAPATPMLTPLMRVSAGSALTTRNPGGGGLFTSCLRHVHFMYGVCSPCVWGMFSSSS